MSPIHYCVRSQWDCEFYNFSFVFRCNFRCGFFLLLLYDHKTVILSACHDCQHIRFNTDETHTRITIGFKTITEKLGTIGDWSSVNGEFVCMQ